MTGLAATTHQRASDVPFTKNLESVAQQARKQFDRGRPFKHVVIDGLFSPDLLSAILEEYPQPTDPRWKAFDSAHQNVLRSGGDSWLGPRTRNFVGLLRSGSFVTFLEQVTGIDGLVADPHSGGLHMVLEGGYLDTHVDYNWNPQLKLENRVNLLVYLNRDWDEGFGGELLLSGQEFSASIAPVFNRLLILAIGEENYHGHPHPLRCDKSESRKSVSLTYCTAWRGSWFGRHPHLYQKSERTRLTKDFIFRMVTPPILHGLSRQVRSRLVRKGRSSTPRPT